MVQISIPKNIVSSLERTQFQGKIFLVDNLTTCNVAISKLRRESIVGIDTETRPSFRKGVYHKVALLQVATADVCYLFRFNKMGFPRIVIDFLEDETITKVGLSLKDDFRKLNETKKIKPQNYIDLQDYVKQYGIIDNSLQRIYAIVFNKYISKNQQLSNWEADVLSQAQMIYAATDAWACLNLYKHLSSNSFDFEHSQYIIEPKQDSEI